MLIRYIRICYKKGKFQKKINVMDYNIQSRLENSNLSQLADFPYFLIIIKLFR